MQLQIIEELILKYEKGETSIEEELLLKDFFSGEEIPNHLRYYQSIFHFYDSESKIKTSSHLDRQILKNIYFNRKNNIRRIAIYGASIAATLILLFTIINQQYQKTPQFTDTFDSPDLAYEETKKVLLAISSQFNEGFSEVKHIEAFNNGLSHITPISEFDKGIKQFDKLTIFNSTQEKVNQK